MTLSESISIALFCFAMVIIVLSALCLLIKLFSFFINFNSRPKSSTFNNKKKGSSLNDEKNSVPVLTTVTDGQGNMQSFKLEITHSREDKR